MWGFHRGSYVSLSVIMNSSSSVVCMPFGRSPSSVNLYVVFRLLLSRYDVIEEKRRGRTICKKVPSQTWHVLKLQFTFGFLSKVPITPRMHAPSLQVWLDAWRVLGLVRCYMCYSSNCNTWCLQKSSEKKTYICVAAAQRDSPAWTGSKALVRKMNFGYRVHFLLHNYRFLQ